MMLSWLLAWPIEPTALHHLPCHKNMTTNFEIGHDDEFFDYKLKCNKINKDCKQMLLSWLWERPMAPTALQHLPCHNNMTTNFEIGHDDEFFDYKSKLNKINEDCKWMMLPG